jgi:uncharacterized protein YegJ (DUF2314 family)
MIAGESHITLHDYIRATFPELRDALRTDDPLEAVFERFQSAVISISDDDPRLLAATAEARRLWPDFVVAFRRRDNQQKFRVKAEVSDGVESEFMWLRVTRISDNMVMGFLDNEPMNLVGIAIGDTIRVAIDDVQDWAYLANGKKHGGFSITAIAATRAQRQAQ